MAARAARKSSKALRAAGPAPRAAEPPPPSAPRADPRRWIYGALDLVFAVGYALAILLVIPNRLPSAQVHLWTLPVAALAMALGMLVGGRRGWWIAVVAGSAMLLSTILLIVRIVISAAFLAGVYGAFGKAAATFSLVMIALVVELVGLLPLIQVKYLMARAGRRAFGR